VPTFALCGRAGLIQSHTASLQTRPSPSCSRWRDGGQPQRDVRWLPRLPHQSDQIVVQHAEVSLVSQLGRVPHSSIIQRLLFATGLVKALSAALTLRRSAWKTRAYQKENRSRRGLLLRQPSAIAAKKSALYNTSSLPRIRTPNTPSFSTESMRSLFAIRSLTVA
jgi:hypothetical protein